VSSPHVPGRAPSSDDPAAAGHNDLVGQPHEPEAEGPIAEAEETAATISTQDDPMGTRAGRSTGKPRSSSRSPPRSGSPWPTD